MLRRTPRGGAWLLHGLVAFALACSDEPSQNEMAAMPLSPDRAPVAEIDRFSESAGTLQVRTAANGLPGPGEPIDFDVAPFVTRGLGPQGERVTYYNFDVQPLEPAGIYVLFREGESAAVSGQLNVVNVIPGDANYNDFWRVYRVRVPANYVANTLTSEEQILASGYAVEATQDLVNCPIVPAGSTARARLGGESPGLSRGWYDSQIVSYFSFSERPLSGDQIPVAPIYVTFNVNPDQAGGGPPSGFRVEAGGVQTHNVLTALPDSADYSPLWSVSPYDNRDFDDVRDLQSIADANVLARGVANVNCPVVDVQAPAGG
jgi:hypothetical protein